MEICRHPFAPLSGTGFTRRLGESVCAPTIRYGVSGPALSGTYQAMIAPPRSTYLPPAEESHASVSPTRRNPALSSASPAFATAWYGVGDAARNSTRPSVCARSKGCRESCCGGAERSGLELICLSIRIRNAPLVLRGRSGAAQHKGAGPGREL